MLPISLLLPNPDGVCDGLFGPVFLLASRHVFELGFQGSPNCLLLVRKAAQQIPFPLFETHFLQRLLLELWWLLDVLNKVGEDSGLGQDRLLLEVSTLLAHFKAVYGAHSLLLLLLLRATNRPKSVWLLDLFFAIGAINFAVVELLSHVLHVLPFGDVNSILLSVRDQLPCLVIH